MYKCEKNNLVMVILQLHLALSVSHRQQGQGLYYFMDNNSYDNEEIILDLDIRILGYRLC